MSEVDITTEQIEDIQPPKRGAKKKIVTGESRVSITIPRVSDHDVDPVPVSVNGYLYLIKRDEVVDVPESVVHVLQNAKETRYNTKTGEQREVMSYPFQYA